MNAAKWISLRNTRVKGEVSVAHSCPTLCNAMDCSPPGSSVHGILSGSILEWVAIPFSRGSAWHRDRTRVSCIAGRFFTIWVTRETQIYIYIYIPCCCCCFSFRSIFRDRDAPRDCHAEWGKSEREEQISWINTYLWNLENGADKPICIADKPICIADTETDKMNCCILYFKYIQTNYLGMLLLWGNRKLKRNSFLFKIIVLISLTDFIIDVIKALKMCSSNWISQNGKKEKRKKISP